MDTNKIYFYRGEGKDVLPPVLGQGFGLVFWSQNRSQNKKHANTRNTANTSTWLSVAQEGNSGASR